MAKFCIKDTVKTQLNVQKNIVDRENASRNFVLILIHVVKRQLVNVKRKRLRPIRKIKGKDQNTTRLIELN